MGFPHLSIFLTRVAPGPWLRWLPGLGGGRHHPGTPHHVGALQSTGRHCLGHCHWTAGMSIQRPPQVIADLVVKTKPFLENHWEWQVDTTYKDGDWGMVNVILFSSHIIYVYICVCLGKIITTSLFSRSLEIMVIL